MEEQTQGDLAQRFQAHRPHLHSVAYRMLGSFADPRPPGSLASSETAGWAGGLRLTAPSDDAVQEAWLRLSRSDADAVANLGGWLTTVVGRIALDMLRSRTSRREDPLDDRLPDPVVTDVDGADPERAAVLADSVSLALLVVLEHLSPVERLVFVLHDLFAVPFEDIARIVERSPGATKQLASRARRRVRGQAPARDADPAAGREVVAAFLAAAHGGDLEGLLAVLDPAVTLRVDQGTGIRVLQGAAIVAGQALTFARITPAGRFALVNGSVGLVTVVDGRTVSVMAVTVHGGRIVELDILADPDRLASLPT